MVEEKDLKMTKRGSSKWGGDVNSSGSRKRSSSSMVKEQAEICDLTGEVSSDSSDDDTPATSRSTLDAANLRAIAEAVKAADTKGIVDDRSTTAPESLSDARSSACTPSPDQSEGENENTDEPREALTERADTSNVSSGDPTVEASVSVCGTF